MLLFPLYAFVAWTGIILPLAILCMVESFFKKNRQNSIIALRKIGVGTEKVFEFLRAIYIELTSISDLLQGYQLYSLTANS